MIVFVTPCRSGEMSRKMSTVGSATVKDRQAGDEAESVPVHSRRLRSAACLQHDVPTLSSRQYVCFYVHPVYKLDTSMLSHSLVIGEFSSVQLRYTVRIFRQKFVKNFFGQRMFR